jgi:hypothetical protein
MVELHVECFVCQCQAVDGIRLRLHAQIEIASVVPPSHVQSRNRFAALVPGKRRWTLDIAVEMVVIDRSHARIVEMAGSMPHAVAVVDAHVAHLHGEKVFQRGLPNVPLVHVRADLERFGLVGTVPDHVHARLLDACEVEMVVPVPQELTPLARRILQHCFKAPILRDT